MAAFSSTPLATAAEEMLVPSLRPSQNGTSGLAPLVHAAARQSIEESHSLAAVPSRLDNRSRDPKAEAFGDRCQRGRYLHWGIACCTRTPWC